MTNRLPHTVQYFLGTSRIPVSPSFLISCVTNTTIPPIRLTSAAEVYAPSPVLRFLVKIALVPQMIMVRKPSSV